LKGKITIVSGQVKELALDDLATFHGMTWNCPYCEYWIYDKMIGSDRGEILGEVLKHYSDCHPVELRMKRIASEESKSREKTNG
jgi:hypothetical protein